ncbi:MAG: hypothetical protein V7K18_25810 [Nostoc sp.]|uniref:hypothetical protein n=1 Tax=Nostoc sp. TaxID=1180 RepID=UPI002FFD19FC
MTPVDSPVGDAARSLLPRRGTTDSEPVASHLPRVKPAAWQLLERLRQRLERVRRSAIERREPPQRTGLPILNLKVTEKVFL